MPNLRSSLFITFLSSNGATVVHLLVTVVLARLLTPSEVGVFSITAVLVGIAHIFRDFGVSSYLQREKELTREKVASAFGVMIATSWVIALLIYLLAATAATFYREKGVESVMQVLALGFLFIPFGSITNTLLTRDYRAREQAYVMVVGTTVYATTAIVLAYAGFGYMAMAWANLANIIASGLAFIPFRPKVAPWLPSLRGWRSVLNFGGGAVLGNSLNMANNAIPDLVLGKLSGAHDVGIMSRATSTTNMISQLLGPTVNYAALPYLSRIHHSKQSMSDPMTRAVMYMTGIIWPAISLIYLNSTDIVLVLYGPQWLESAVMVKIICMAAAVSTCFSFTSSAYMAIGRPYLTSIPTTALIALKACFIVSIYDGSLVSFGYALAIATVVNVPLQLWMQQHYLRIGWLEFCSSLLRSGMVTLACICGSLIWYWLPETTPKILSLAAKTSTTGLFWLFSIYMVQHPLLQEISPFVERTRKFAISLILKIR